MTEFIYRDQRLLNKYFFPLATSKTIHFNDIESVALLDAHEVNHQWGPSRSYLNDWFPLDTQRKNKDKFIEFKLKGEKIRPTFTPQQPDIVFNLIWQNHTKDGQKYVQQYKKGKQNTRENMTARIKEQSEKHKDDNNVIKIDQNTMIVRGEPLEKRKDSN